MTGAPRHPAHGAPVTHRRAVLTGASLAFGARAAGAVLMLGFQVLVARRAGTADAGRFYLVFAVTSVLALLGRYGTDQLILRSVALRHGDEAALAATYRSAVALAGRLLAAVSLALLALAGWLATAVFGDAALAGPLRVAALGVVPFGLVAVQGEAIKGLGRPGLGSVVQSIVGPVVSLALLAALGTGASATAVSAAYVVGLVAASAVAQVLWRRGLARTAGPSGNQAGASGPAAHPWHRRAGLGVACRPFFASSAYGLVLAWAAVIALGLTAPPADLAAFFAADRWTAVASMVLVAFNSSVGPHFARLWATGSVVEARALLRETTRTAVVTGALLFAATVVLAPRLLALFGEDFGGATTALRVLALGQLVVLAGGPITSFVVMAGRERDQARAGAIASVVAVGLLVLLAPGHGLVGAAVASALALVVNKVLIARTLLLVLAEERDRGDVSGRVPAARHR